MATLERTYNVPLRRTFVRSPKYKRSKRAVTILKEFIAKHMKAAEIKIGKNLNEFIWKDGIQNPPHHVKVQLVRDDKGVVRAELFGKKYEEPTKEDREKATKEKPAKPKKISEKVEQKPELADQALKDPKGLKEEAEFEKKEEELMKEEELPEHVREEEEDIKAGLESVKVEPKAAKPKAAKAKASK